MKVTIALTAGTILGTVAITFVAAAVFVNGFVMLAVSSQEARLP